MRGGVAFALAAGLIWGAVYICPLALPAYPAPMLAFGRYFAFGLVALPLGWIDRARLRGLSAADWTEALKLSLVGNFVYFTCLAGAIQRAGAPLPTMIVGTLPVVIAITANLRNAKREGQLPWRQLLPALAVIAAGLFCVNHVALAALAAETHPDFVRYGCGVALAVTATVCWTWYPLRNADWLKRHAGRSSRAWTTAQGLVCLPLGALGFAVLRLVPGLLPGGFAPLGPTPWFYGGMMLALGFSASWLGTVFWNAASKRLSTALGGQLIVFETLAALAYAFAWKGTWPAPLEVLGIALLIAGVVCGVRIRPVAP